MVLLVVTMCLVLIIMLISMIYPYISVNFLHLLSLAKQYNDKVVKHDKTVISLTTIPSRMPYIEQTLKSLLRQDRVMKIILNIPLYSDKEQCKYKIPHNIRRMEQKYPWFCINRIEQDYGPASKLLPILKLTGIEKIIVCDDDVIYGPQLVRQLVDGSNIYPDCAITIHTSSNYQYTPGVSLQDKDVTIVRGYSGYLVRPQFFKSSNIFDYTNTPRECRISDDLWISGHLLANNIKIMCLKFSIKTIPWPSASFRINAIHRTDNKQSKSDKIVKQYFKKIHGVHL